MKKVMAFGTFDLFHEGHKNFLSQAHQYGDYLIVVVARDKTVTEIKKYQPTDDEKKRLDNIKKSNLADEVILGGLGNKYEILGKFRPDVVCLGYDQKSFIDDLPRKLEELGLKDTKIIRLKAFKPEIYKSSKLRIKKQV